MAYPAAGSMARLSFTAVPISTDGYRPRTSPSRATVDEKRCGGLDRKLRSGVLSAGKDLVLTPNTETVVGVQSVERSYNMMGYSILSEGEL